jgi:hypothetical protein
VTLTTRDRRALVLLGVAAAAVILFVWSTGDSGQPAVVGAADSIGAAERRLARVRRIAEGVPGRRELFKRVSGELAEREKGILQAESAAQAQAQLLEILRRVARSQTPPIELGSVELPGQVTKLGDRYAEVQIVAPFTCHIEELVNLLADLSRQPEAIATSDLRVGAPETKLKTIGVRLVISGLVPVRLAGGSK